MKTSTPTLRRMAAGIHSLPLAIALLALPTLASAATFTWDGGGTTDNWSDAANWVGDAAPANDGTADIVFAGSTRITPVVDAAWNVKSIAFSAGSGAFSLSGSALTVQGSSGVNTDAITNSSSVTQTLGNALTLGTAQSWNNTTAGGKLVINGTVTSNVEFRANNNVGQIDINGVVSGTGTFKKNNGGTVSLNAPNTFTSVSASVDVFNGTTLVGANAPVGAAGAFGNSGGFVNLGVGTTFNSTASLLTNGAFTIGRSLRLRSVTSGSNNVTIGGNTADVSTYAGAIQLGENTLAANAVTLTAATGGRVNITGNLTRATGATGTNDSVTKIGNGTVVLAGAGNTYLGVTTVTAGTLLVNGTLSSGGGNVTVASGSTLGGTGNTQRNVIVNGTLATGDGGIGTFGTAALDLNTGSTFAFDLNTTSVTSDLVNANGAFNLTGTVTLSLTDLGANVALADGTQLTIASYSGLWNGGTFNGLADDSQFVFGANTWKISYNDTTGTGLYSNFATLTVVPEPATWGLLAIGLTFLVTCRRRSRML